MMPVTIGGGLTFCGRELKPGELDPIRRMTREFSTLSLTELAHTLCELPAWRRPNGGLKGRECFVFLRDLQERGWLPWLPPPQPKKGRPRATVWDERSDEQMPLTGGIGDYLPVRLQLLDSSEDRLMFRQYYFVRSLQPRCPLLACLPFTGAAWKMAPRDTSIGWSDTARQTNLPPVVNNSRFLILLWVRVPNLASHVLSLAARQLPRDWSVVYHAQPVLMETPVDGTRYHGGSIAPPTGPRPGSPKAGAAGIAVARRKAYASTSFCCRSIAIGGCWRHSTAR